MTIPDTFRPILIADGVRASAERTPNKVAISLADRRLSYRGLVERIDRVSNLALGGLGLARGDRAALMAPNCLEFIEIVAGLSSVGVAPAMVNPRLTAPEAAYIANDSGARVLFVHESLEEVARAAELETVERIVLIGGDYEELIGSASTTAPEVAVSETDAFCISYTSGTTGNPKGAVLSHRSRTLTFYAMAAEYGCYSPDDRALAIAPLYHGAGFAYAVAPIFFGGTCEILPRFEPERVLAVIDEARMTNAFFVPTHFHAIFGLDDQILQRYKAESLRTIIANAAPLPQVTKERIVEYFGEGLLHETYGSTEAGLVSNLRPPDQLRKQQCVGLPFPCTLVRLRDDEGGAVAPGEVGELFSASPSLFSGYWGMPEATAETFRGGWLSVGDMARQDEEGYIYLVDRKKDIIISGGVNVYPREIEEVLLTHPNVAEAAVVGQPDDYWGETVRAVVVLGSAAEASEAELLDHCGARLARYKLPKSFSFVEALPRNAAGKILKRELRLTGG
jgi:long-chain acyl-CoA synthetase